MAKVIRGTQDNKRRTILKQPAGGAGRVRCPKCQNLAVQEMGASGKPQYKCQGCGSTITSKPL